MGGSVTIHPGDNRLTLRRMIDEGVRVHSCVTDPPYGLTSITKRFGKDSAAPAKHGTDGAFKRASGGFMGKTWDGTGIERDPEFWRLIWEILLPGGCVFAFSGSRTGHWQACAMEMAGFIMHPMHGWIFGSGFPKAHDASKAIDRLKDWSLIERLSKEICRARTESGLSLLQIGQRTLEVTGGVYGKWYHRGGHMFFETGRNLPSRPEWDQLRNVLPIGTEFFSVYDAAEREVVGVKSGTKLAVAPGQGLDRSATSMDVTSPATPEAAQWDGWAYGTQTQKPALEPIYLGQRPFSEPTGAANLLKHGVGAFNVDGCRVGSDGGCAGAGRGPQGAVYGDGLNGSFAPPVPGLGRWPANLLHDGSPEVVALFPDSKGQLADASTSDTQRGGQNVYGVMKRGNGRNGEASAERRYTEEGSTNFAAKPGARRGDSGSAARFFNSFEPDADPVFYQPKAGRLDRAGSPHPTVKPIALMRHLIRHITPPGGTVLDPFAGSGTTGEAARQEGFDCILMEAEPEYVEFLQARFAKPMPSVQAAVKRPAEMKDSRQPDLFEPFAGAAE